MPSLNHLLTTALAALTASVHAVDNAKVTFYDTQNASNMNFGACEQPLGILAAPYGAAMSLADNGDKQACGKCINVHYQGKSVKVQVLDKCVGCPQGALDLWAGAFEVLAPLDTGVIQASWEFVGC
ncbi:hypothetical protein MBLNU13_g11037t1 [Cladosporium sp. NU13]